VNISVLKIRNLFILQPKINKDCCYLAFRIPCNNIVIIKISFTFTKLAKFDFFIVMLIVIRPNVRDVNGQLRHCEAVSLLFVSILRVFGLSMYWTPKVKLFFHTRKSFLQKLNENTGKTTFYKKPAKLLSIPKIVTWMHRLCQYNYCLDQAWATSGPRATYGPPSTLMWPASYIWKCLNSYIDHKSI